MLIGWLAGSALVGCTADEPPGAEPPPSEVIVDGLTVHYDRAGALSEDAGTPAIVLAHGAASDATVWEEQVAALSERHLVLALDLPGHGRSDKPEEAAYPARLFSDATLAVMDQEGVDRAVLVGHSFGVSVMRDVLSAAPERVQGITMIDGFVVPLIDSPALAEAVIGSFEANFEQAAESFVESNMFGPDTPADVRDRVRAMMLAAPKHIWLAVLAIALDPEVESAEVDDAPGVGLFTQNAYVPADYDAYLSTRFPAVEYRTAATGRGHFLSWEDPQAVTQAIVDTVAME